MLREIRKRAPHAQIVVVTYPAILPPTGTCPKLAINSDQAAMMRIVGERLAEVTRNAAQRGQAILVDMQRFGAAHHACSEVPWVNGWVDVAGAKYHPTINGAAATAAAIASALK